MFRNIIIVVSSQILITLRSIESNKLAILLSDVGLVRNGIHKNDKIILIYMKYLHN